MKIQRQPDVPQKRNPIDETSSWIPIPVDGQIQYLCWKDRGMQYQFILVGKKIWIRKAAKGSWRKRALRTIEEPGRVLYKQIVGLVNWNQSPGEQHHLGEAITRDAG